MLDVLPYIIYFLGPFLLAFFLGKKILKAQYRAFAVGLLTFFVAWIFIMVISQLPAAGSESFQEDTILYALIISASAGLFEESGRYFSFRIFKSLRERRDLNTGIMYAVGHSGMESIIVGGNLLLTTAVVKYAPEVLSPKLLEESKEVLEIGFHQGLYNSLERLLVGLLIHSCFTLLVLLSLMKSKKKYLWFAMLWHFGHDMVGFSLHRISEHWIVGKLWIIFVVVVYSWILVRLSRQVVRETTL